MVDIWKVSASVVAGTVVSWTQEYSTLLSFVTIAIVFDVLTGVLKVISTDEKWHGRKALKGFWNKISLYCGLAIGVFLDFFIPFMAKEVGIHMDANAHLSYIFAAYIVLNELISACQNLQQCNSHIMPSWVLRLLKSSAEQIEQKGPTEKNDKQ